MRNPKSPISIKKAITFRAASIGDCLMAKHFLENIHAEYPTARCGIVIASRAEMIRDLLRAYPWIEVIEVNRRKPLAILKLIWRYWRSDVVVTPYTGGSVNLSTKLVARILAKSGALIGYKDKSFLNTFLDDVTIPLSTDRSRASRLLELDAISAVGIQYSKTKLALDIVPAVTDFTELAAGKYVVLHFFAGGKGRSISPDKARELLSSLVNKLPSIKFVVSGGAQDRSTAATIAEGFPARVIAGDVSLQELMKIISLSLGVVSVDTGVAHITAHLGVPLVVMRSCLGRGWWLPEQYDSCLPIRQFSREELCTTHVYQDYPMCIETISTDEVVEVAAKFFTST